MLFIYVHMFRKENHCFLNKDLHWVTKAKKVTINYTLKALHTALMVLSK